MPWICEDCNTNNEDSELECHVCGYSKASSVESAAKRAAEEDKRLRAAREAEARERAAREKEEREKKARDAAELASKEREEKRRAKEVRLIAERARAEREAAALRAAREAKERAKTGGGFKPGYTPKVVKSKKSGKVFLVLLLIGLAVFGAVLISRTVNFGSSDSIPGSVNWPSNKPTPTPTPAPTEVPRQYAYITNVDSGALVFKEPRRSSDTITKIRKGERVEIVEYELDGEWCIINYNDIYAYIQLKYLELE